MASFQSSESTAEWLTPEWLPPQRLTLEWLEEVDIQYVLLAPTKREAVLGPLHAAGQVAHFALQQGLPALVDTHIFGRDSEVLLLQRTAWNKTQAPVNQQSPICHAPQVAQRFGAERSRSGPRHSLRYLQVNLAQLSLWAHRLSCTYFFVLL